MDLTGKGDAAASAPAAPPAEILENLVVTMPLRATLVALACAFLLALAAPFALADADGHGKGGPPGDNGTVKVHRSTTPADDPRNEPHVCTFYLAAFHFDSGQQVAWNIKAWPPTGDRETVKTGTLTVGADGMARTGDMSLPDGHYKLFWQFAGEHGAAKHKVFWVKCESTTPSPSETPTKTPTTSPSTPEESKTPSAPTPSAVRTHLPVTG